MAPAVPALLEGGSETILVVDKKDRRFALVAIEQPRLEPDSISYFQSAHMVVSVGAAVKMLVVSMVVCS